MDITDLGKKAENKLNEWLHRPEEGCMFMRIPDQMTGMYGSSNISDFILYRKPNFYFIESKATYENSFPFSMISPYQHDNMLKESKIEGVTSYIAVLYASFQRAFLFDINDIEAQVQAGGRKSLNINKIDSWTIPYIEIRTLPSKKQLRDYDPAQIAEIF